MIKALLALVLACATCLHAESESFQKEVAASISNAKSGSKSAEALQYLSEKLSQGVWTFDPTPIPEQITSMKPRLKAKALLPNTATAYAPRWEVFQKQDAAGVCKPLSLPELRTTATLAASDCPSATPKPNAFLVDESGLGSLEQSPAQGEEQRGFIAVGDLEQLSPSQSEDYFTKPQRLTPSSGIQAIALKFLAFVPDDAAKPASVKALRVQAGNLIAEVPVAAPPSAPISVPVIPADPTGFGFAYQPVSGSCNSLSMKLAWASPGTGAASYRLAYNENETAPSDCNSGTVVNLPSSTLNHTYGKTQVDSRGRLNYPKVTFRLCSVNSSGTNSGGVVLQCWGGLKGVGGRYGVCTWCCGGQCKAAGEN